MKPFHRAFNRVREQTFALDGLMGFDLHGKTAGVIGTGQIGEVVCKILSGGVREFPTRIKCASLAWHTMKAAVAHDTDAPVSTE